MLDCVKHIEDMRVNVNVNVNAVIDKHLRISSEVFFAFATRPLEATNLSTACESDSMFFIVSQIKYFDLSKSNLIANINKQTNK